MTQEEKQLLLKDLCGRLPYGLKFQSYHSECGIEGKGTFDFEIGDDATLSKLKHLYESGNNKPYLRPMSSMTDEEYGQYMEFIEWSYNDYDGTAITCINKERLHEYLDFIYSHHLDDNNFIEKGLALEAKEGMYKI